MAAKKLVYEIFDVCGIDPEEIHLLVHVEEDPDDWETFRTAVVRLSRGVLLADIVWNDWAKCLWQSPSGAIYVPGADGAIYSKASDQWVSVSLGRKFTFEDIWGFADDLMYCCGLRAALFRRGRDGWGPFNQGLSGDLKAIRGTAPDDLYVLGMRGVVFHHDGVQWGQMPSPTNNRLVSILPLSRGEVYFCGYNGMFFRLANGAWENLSLQGDPVNLYRMVKYRERLFVSAADKGVFEFDDHSLVPFAPHILAGRMHVIGGKLFAVGGDLLHIYDGSNWASRKLDFSQVIPA